MKGIKFLRIFCTIIVIINHDFPANDLEDKNSEFKSVQFPTR